MDTKMPAIKKVYITNTMVAKVLLDGDKCYEATDIVTMHGKASITVKLDVRNKALNKQERILTIFDLAVMDSVYTIYACGTKVITAEMVARVLSGKLHSNITKQRVDDVKWSLYKLSQIRIKIDATEEMIIRKNIKKNEICILDGCLLALASATITVGSHKTMEGYIIREKPILYKYAELARQRVDVTLDVYTAGDRVSTKEEILLRRYILLRIKVMKNRRNKVTSKRISYSWYDVTCDADKGLLAAMGYKECDYKQWRTKKNTVHKMVVDILDALVAVQYIAGYTVVHEGKQKIVGVDLIL